MRLEKWSASSPRALRRSWRAVLSAFAVGGLVVAGGAGVSATAFAQESTGTPAAVDRAEDPASKQAALDVVDSYQVNAGQKIWNIGLVKTAQYADGSDAKKAVEIVKDPALEGKIEFSSPSQIVAQVPGDYQLKLRLTLKTGNPIERTVALKVWPEYTIAPTLMKYITVDDVTLKSDQTPALNEKFKNVALNLTSEDGQSKYTFDNLFANVGTYKDFESERQITRLDKGYTSAAANIPEGYFFAGLLRTGWDGATRTPRKVLRFSANTIGVPYIRPLFYSQLSYADLNLSESDEGKKTVTPKLAHEDAGIALKFIASNFPKWASLDEATGAVTVDAKSVPAGTRELSVITKYGDHEVTRVTKLKVRKTVDAGVVTPVPQISKDQIVPAVIHKGDDLTLGAANIKDLPEGAKAEDVTADGAVNTAKPGEYTGKIKVTFKDGSSRVVEVPVTVKDRVPAATLEPAQPINPSEQPGNGGNSSETPGSEPGTPGKQPGIGESSSNSGQQAGGANTSSTPEGNKQLAKTGVAAGAIGLAAIAVTGAGVGLARRR